MSVQKWGSVFFNSHFVSGNYGSKQVFFRGEWAVQGGLKINLKHQFFASLTVGSRFRLTKKCIVKL